MQRIGKNVSLAAFVAAGVLVASSAHANTINFFQITANGDPVAHNVSAQLRAVVADNGAGSAIFTFYNDVGIPSSIARVYFDDNSSTLKGITDVATSPGVAFASPDYPGPANLPGGENASPEFVAVFSAGSTPPPPKNGVAYLGEWVALTFSLHDGKTYQDLIAALASPPAVTSGLRLGMHVISIKPEGYTGSYKDVSNGYLSQPISVPDTGTTASLLGFALAGLAIAVRLKP